MARLDEPAVAPRIGDQAASSSRPEGESPRIIPEPEATEIAAATFIKEKRTTLVTTPFYSPVVPLWYFIS